LPLCRPRPGTAAALSLILLAIGAASLPLQSAADEPPAAPPAPLELTLGEALLRALEHNPDLAVQRLNPTVMATFEDEEEAVFDPVLAAEASAGRERTSPPSVGHQDTTQAGIAATLSKSTPAGTDIAVGLSTTRQGSNQYTDAYVTRLGLTVNQALLRGAGTDTNLATLRQARLDTLASDFELRGFAEALVATTEQTYWNLALSQRTIDIVTNALALAEQNLRETRERIRVGILAETEAAAAEAEVARRQESLINARSALQVTRLHLLRLLNLPGRGLGDDTLALRTPPVTPDLSLDPVETYVEVAMRMRADLNQARLSLERRELELVKTRNGLLPRLDLFVTLGKSGYAESFVNSLGNLPRRDYDVLAGLRLEFPPANRAAEARHARAFATRQQTELAIENLRRLVEEDVRAAYIEVTRTREQIAATAATRRHAEETLRVETEKSRVGKSTSFLVAQAQRDLLQAQVAEVGAVVGCLKAVTELHLQQGALLERRGINAPGATAVRPPELERAP